MIAGILDDAHRYYCIHPFLPMAFKYLAGRSYDDKPPGRYEIYGNEVFALVQDYETIVPEDMKWEAHNRHLDIQFMANGCEQMLFAQRDGADVVEAYNPEKDILFLSPNDWGGVTLKDDRFIVLFPEDAHMGCIAAGAKMKVRKVLIKVLI